MNQAFFVLRRSAVQPQISNIAALFSSPFHKTSKVLDTLFHKTSILFVLEFHKTSFKFHFFQHICRHCCLD